MTSVPSRNVANFNSSFPILRKWVSKVILKISNRDMIHAYRVLERNTVKLIRTTSHRNFNETCLNNNLLPNYSKIKLPDKVAREKFTKDFRRKIVNSEIEEQDKEIENLRFTILNNEKDLELLLDSHLKFSAFQYFLENVISGLKVKIEMDHQRKLSNLYNGRINLKERQDCVVNLSTEKIDPTLNNILNLGLNCHLKSKYSKLRKKIEIEKLFRQIEREKSSGNVEISDQEKLKCELKRFGLREIRDFDKDLLTREEHKIVREFVENEDIIVRKADKNNTFVVMTKSSYLEKLDLIVGDENKFLKLDKDPTEDLKKKLNRLIETCNNRTNDYRVPKLIGHFKPGYLYGNPKIHKDLSDPPLRPIISQIGTPSNEVAKNLNNLLKSYLPERYSINSTDEFISLTKATTGSGILASLDVENLFTNVPVRETIDLIIQYAYQDPDRKPPPIDDFIMKELLLTCTTETPFKHPNGNIFIQTDGVSMGSPLGPLFANFYMCHLENNVLNALNTENKPNIYCRYVDDIFLTVQDPSIIFSLKEKLQNSSCLKFTYEIENNRTINFLDVKINANRKTLNTEIYVKPTSSGQCINFHSIAPYRYKTGVIKTLLNRAYKICSSNESLNSEIERLKQLFTNNNFPMKTIEKEISNFISKKHHPESQNPDEPTTDPTTLYYRNQMSSQYQQEEKNLQNIIENNVKPIRNQKIKLMIYYRNKKLSNLLIRNNPHKDSEDHHVVYQYKCPSGECEPPQTYIGYTTTTLKQRTTTHAQNGSIKNHNSSTHQLKIRSKDILDNTTVIFRSIDMTDLTIAEALLIKTERPLINNQKEGETRILKIF